MLKSKYNTLKLISIIGILASFMGLFLYLSFFINHSYVGVVSFVGMAGFSLLGVVLLVFDLIKGKYRKVIGVFIISIAALLLFFVIFKVPVLVDGLKEMEKNTSGSEAKNTLGLAGELVDCIEEVECKSPECGSKSKRYLVDKKFFLKMFDFNIDPNKDSWGIDPVWDALNIESDLFSHERKVSNIDFYELDVYGGLEKERIVVLEGGGYYQGLIFKNNGDNWEFIDNIDFGYLKAYDPNLGSVKYKGEKFLTSNKLSLDGTGLHGFSNFFYLISSQGTEEVLSYPTQLNYYGWVSPEFQQKVRLKNRGPLNWRHSSPEEFSDYFPGGPLHYNMVCKKASPEDGDEGVKFSEKEGDIYYTWDEKNKEFRYNEEKSTLTEDIFSPSGCEGVEEDWGEKTQVLGSGLEF